jgi:hypothetical protein
MTVQTLRFFLAWIFLNVLINLNYPAPESHLLAPFLASPEIIALLLIVCAAVWFGMPFRSSVYLPLTVLVILFRLFRIGDVLVPTYFNRPFNLYIDVRYVPDLFHLLYTTVSPGAFIGYLFVGLALFVMIFWGIWKAVATIHHHISQTRHKALLTGALAGLMALFLAFQLTNKNLRLNVFTEASIHRVFEEMKFILKVQGHKKESFAIIREAIEKTGHIPTTLDKLERADIFLMFIESYGHTVYADSRHFSMLASFIKGFERDLKAGGFDAVSNFLEAPTYGGSSWLTHATIASGIQLNTQMLYNLLIFSQAKTIAGYFNDAGYRTVSVMPGTTWPWPEGEFFGYQKKYYAWHFDYNGPRYGWSPMPDQYVLDFIHRSEIQHRRQPLFIEFVLVTSHAPFHMQPAYLEDWSRIKDGAVYHRQEPITFPVTWPELTNASEAYMTSILYDLTVIKAFIQQFVKEETLIIIMGDHQPNVRITGESRPWSVPVHVISRNPGFLQPFAARGYTSGLIPRQPPPHLGMEKFLFDFLADFSTAKSQTELTHMPAGKTMQDGSAFNACKKGKN